MSPTHSGSLVTRVMLGDSAARVNKIYPGAAPEKTGINCAYCGRAMVQTPP